jgi:N-acetylglucosamine kinase-like BadF-type ATPase
MVLITDGGSTKCDWILLDNRGEVRLKTRTLGLNPAVIAAEELQTRIKANSELLDIAKNVTTLDFFGAGCGTATPVMILLDVLQKCFPNATVSVNEDIMAAVLSVTNKPGIVCILGTGSNSCYFDGKTVHLNTPSLGYSVMDEASGNYFGKQLLRDYFYKKMPSGVARDFESRFDLDPDHIKNQLYKQPNPNAYLASFAEFIFSSETEKEYFSGLLSEGIHTFIKNRILTFSEAKQFPVHFVGSVAYFSEDIITNALQQYNLQAGNFVKRPIDGLISYYKAHKLTKE